MRTCVGCRRARPTGELVRIARDPVGRLVVGRHLPGRGAWLCRGSVACLDRALSKRAFERALRVRLEEGQVDRDHLVGSISVPAGRVGGSEGPPR